MFDSPFEFCSVCRQYVLLDQTQPQCAYEHGCSTRTACPLAKYFTGFEFDAAAGSAADPSHHKRGPPAGAGM